jgi:putative component of membrane protein insertase Oxa1/YidC/SpoIIIJ protein YidD
VITKTAIVSIELYQKYISPHKGFCCAYRVYHEDLSCSEFALQTIEQNGILKSIAKIKNRFKECKLASNYIQDEYELNSKKEFKESKFEKCGKCGTDACSVAPCFTMIFT